MRTLTLGLAIGLVPSLDVAAQTVPHLEPTSAWPGFRIFVWQYKTDAERDLPLYRSVGLQAFHVDYGAGQQKRVQFAQREQMAFYVDHAAGKGILHLTERRGKGDLPTDGSLAPRPQSLADEAVIAELQQQLRANLPATQSAWAAAYALDDEVSIGVFNNSLEVDASPASLAKYRSWLQEQYVQIERLNAQWKTRYESFAEIEPTTYGDLQEEIKGQPFSQWNLAPWIDWRSFNDSLFAQVLGSLVREANEIAPKVPTGIVGGQQPAPYGGFDYEKLAPQLQWIEAYDIGGTNEILRSFWSGENSRPRVQTFFSSGDPKVDSWFLWYYYVHGNRGVIAWPDSQQGPWFADGEVAPAIQSNAATFRELQGELGERLFTKSTEFEHDGIAVLYSHPSVQAGWAADALVHGRTWPRRSSGLDNTCQSAGKNRVAWFKLLEDCGYQYQVVGRHELAGGTLQAKGFRVLILPRCLAMSAAECDAVRQFVAQGGVVIADYWTALLDEHGTGRAEGGLDDLFAIRRDESAGYFNGHTLAEIDGEKYQQPFLQRLPEEPVTRRQGVRLVELGTRPSADEERAVGQPSFSQRTAVGQGEAIYLNASPLEYWDNSTRAGKEGAAWRELLSAHLTRAGIEPKFAVVDPLDGSRLPMVEVVRWRQADQRVLAIVANPTRQGAIDQLGELGGLSFTEREIELQVPAGTGPVVDLRSGQVFEAGQPIRLRWRPWEALMLSLPR